MEEPSKAAVAFSVIFIILVTLSWINYGVLYIFGLSPILFSSTEQPASGMSYYVATLSQTEMSLTIVYGVDYWLLHSGILSPIIYTLCIVASFVSQNKTVTYLVTISVSVLFGLIPDVAKLLWYIGVLIFGCNAYWYCHAWRGPYYFLLAWSIAQIGFWVVLFCAVLGFRGFGAKNAHETNPKKK